MAEIVLFTPRRELNADANLEGFVDVCRSQLTVFGAGLNFDALVWDVTEQCARKAQGDKRERVSFCTLASANEKVKVPMSPGFLPFAHAYIRYMQGMRPVVGLGFRMAALRALDASLSENGENFSPVKADVGIFNRAAQLINDGFSKSAAYRIGMQLEMVADFLSTNCLTSIGLQWRNTLKRPTDSTRVGKEFDERRTSKLPSQAALDAIPKAYRLADEPAHILVTATAAILCSAPDRINEVLSLPLDCETSQSKEDGAQVYGIRWWPSKGAEPMVKWVIPSMSSVVKDALGKIRQVTDEARKISHWYEKNPTKIYLSAHLEHLRNQEFISMSELNDILWSGKPNASSAPRGWCLQREVSTTKVGGRLFVSFKAVEIAVLAMLPDNFPVFERERGTKYSEALFVVQRNQFHQEKATYACMVEAVVIQHINDGLGARSEHGSKSVFDALGFVGDDGNAICITTHQFRHYLNTLAQAGGLSQLDIAKWSGRKDISQNSSYDHVSADEMVAKIRADVGHEDRILGPLATIPKNILIPRDEFARMKIPTAHTTEFGFCIHDYTMSPCQLHRDCINCEEQVCVKGDKGKQAALQLQLDEARGLLAAAQDAMQKGYVGSDRWMEHHALTTERLSKLCEILNNPDVPVGSVVQLSIKDAPSRIAQAEETRLSLHTTSLGVNSVAAGIDTDDETAAALDFLRDFRE